MKFVIAAVAALTASSASAAELGLFGLTAGGETVAEYNVDQESMLLTIEPNVGYTIQPFEIDLTASALMTVYEDDFVLGDTMPVIDLEARKALLMEGLEVYGNVGYDLEAEERTDLKVGMSFNF